MYKEIDPITAKMPWDFENDIGRLQVAIAYLKEASLRSYWVDDGSGLEYSQEQYKKADKNRRAAIDEINQAMQHIDCIMDDDAGRDEGKQDSGELNANNHRRRN